MTDETNFWAETAASATVPARPDNRLPEHVPGEPRAKKTLADYLAEARETAVPVNEITSRGRRADELLDLGSDIHAPKARNETRKARMDPDFFASPWELAAATQAMARDGRFNEQYNVGSDPRKASHIEGYNEARNEAVMIQEAIKNHDFDTSGQDGLRRKV